MKSRAQDADVTLTKRELRPACVSSGSACDPHSDVCCGLARCIKDPHYLEYVCQGRQDGFPLTQIRQLDGTQNNIGGEVNAILRRVGPTNYPDDGFGETIRKFPNPRLISRRIMSQGQSIPSQRGLSDYIWGFGQFLDHDLGITPGDNKDDEASIPIDRRGDALGPPGTNITFFRVKPVDGTGEYDSREFKNEITSFLDASLVYGSDSPRAAALRTFQHGKLKTGRPSTIDSPKDFRTQIMPDNKLGWKNERQAGVDPKDEFLAGDIRANEQVVLGAFHTLFLREHNRLCDRIRWRYPEANDQQIYDLARKIVGMEIQKITYDEFLPALLGPLASRLTSYRGHDPHLHAGLSVEFSTAGFRFGHSTLSSKIPFVNARGRKIRVSLRNAFFDLKRIKNGPKRVDNIFRGLITQKAQDVDTFIVNDVRNALFGRPGKGGSDLGSLNIQRGRDLGIPNYNQARVAYGLKPKATFSEVTSNSGLARNLKRLYGTPDNIDLLIGCLAEDHISGASVGELLGEILVEQFDRLMHGDKFFYLNDPDLTQRNLQGIIRLDSMKLSDIIRFNTGARFEIGTNMFFAH